MNPLWWIVTYGCKLGLCAAFRIDAKELKTIRREGPLIVYSNHTGLAEAPILYTFLKPRPKVTAFGKVELSRNPFGAFLFKLWGVIPIRRGEADMDAMRKALEALSAGYILGLAPEGTRSKTGKLLRARAGVSVIALHSKAPLQPIAHWRDGTIREQFRKFKRPGITMRVGPAFRIDPKDRNINKEARQEIADEMMYQLAMLMPEDLRGEYADMSKATTNWLVFE